MELEELSCSPGTMSLLSSTGSQELAVHLATATKDAKRTCPLCLEEVECAKLRGHVGTHILKPMRNVKEHLKGEQVCYDNLAFHNYFLFTLSIQGWRFSTLRLLRALRAFQLQDIPD